MLGLHRFVSRNVVLMLVIAALVTPGRVTASTGSTSHHIQIHGEYSTVTEGAFVITGSGFTAGAEIQILLFDRNGMRFGHVQHTTASSSTPEAGESGLPYHFYAITGFIYHILDYPCGAVAMIQAYDSRQDNVSNIITVPDPPDTCIMSPRRIP